MAGIKDEFGLTPKQRKFAENIIGGMNLSDAYRNSYDASGMTNAQIHREASLLGSDQRVAQCMEALAAVKRRQSEAVTVSDRDMLVDLLRKWSKGSESATSSQLRAAELLGKACGLYRDVIEDHRERPAAAVAAELESKLAGLLQPPVVNVTLTEVVEERLDADISDDDAVPAGSDDVRH